MHITLLMLPALLALGSKLQGNVIVACSRPVGFGIASDLFIACPTTLDQSEVILPLVSSRLCLILSKVQEQTFTSMQIIYPQ